MNERYHCMSGVCPRTSENGQGFSIYVDYPHPLLQLKRALNLSNNFNRLGEK